MGAVQCSEDRSLKYISTSDVEVLVCVYIHMCIRTYVCMYVYVYICMCVHMYVCTCVLSRIVHKFRLLDKHGTPNYHGLPILTNVPAITAFKGY